MIPSATPAPVVWLVGVGQDGAVGRAVRSWAEARGFRVGSASGFEADEDSVAEAIAWVSMGRPPAWSDWVLAAIPGVVVDPVGVEPSQTVSTVGGAGSRDDQAGFMAGVMAGLASRTWVVGLIDEMGGPQDRVLAQGFVQGVRYSCPRCQIVRQTGAEAAAQRLAATLTDVVFVAPGAGYEEVWQKLVGVEVGAVWVGSAPQVIVPQQLVGGVEYEPSALVLSALEALLAGEPGRRWPYSIVQGGLRLELQGGWLSPGRLRLVEQTWQQLAVGALDTGVDPTTGEGR